MITPAGRIPAQVEEEYGLPFWEVVKSYADDGESIHATAALIGYRTHCHLRLLIARHNVQHWFKPSSQTNGAIAARKNNTGAYFNELARKNAGESSRKRHAVEALGELDSIAGHCRRLGVRYGTVMRRIHRYGMTLEQALTAPAHSGKRRNGDHAWRKT